MTTHPAVSKYLTERLARMSKFQLYALFRKCCDDVSHFHTLLDLNSPLLTDAVLNDSANLDAFKARQALASIISCSELLVKRSWAALYALSAYDGLPLPSVRASRKSKRNLKGGLS